HGGGDLASFIYPVYTFAARWLKQGVVPLWNPHLYMGMPFAADNQSGLFYPLNLLFFFLTSTLSYDAVELMAVSHVFLAGLFTYLLLRDLSTGRGQPVGRIAALAGAITYMLSDLYVIHVGNLNIIATATWLPLALLCFRRALNRPGWGWVGWSGVVLGTAALVGHAQMFLYVCIALGLYTLFEICERWCEGGKTIAALVGKLALCGLIAFGLSALALIPAFDLPQYTVRATMDYPDASEFAIPPAGLLGIVMPGFWGRGPGGFWGPWLRTEMGYAGVLPLLLAAIGATWTWRRHRLTRYWLLLGGFGLLTALGAYTALHGWTYALIPFFRQLRVPARAIFAFDFAVAILAAYGLDALLKPLPRQSRRILNVIQRGSIWIFAVLALIGAPLLGYAALAVRASRPDLLPQTVTALNSLIFFLVLLGAGLGWLLLRRRGLAGSTASSRAALGIAAIALIAFDLISLGATVEVEPNDPLVGYGWDNILEFLSADEDVFRVEVLSGAPVSWLSDWALIHEMDDFGGIWNPLRLGAYDVLTWAGISRDETYYDLYNIKYIVAHKDTAMPAHWEHVFTQGDAYVYRNPRAMPRAWLVYNAQVVNGAIAALSAARAPDFDPAAQAILEREWVTDTAGAQHGKLGEFAAPLPDSQSGQVEITDRGPNHLTIAVRTPAEAYLVVSEMWMPGWVARVDGEKEAVVRANFTFRAVRVPAGDHEIKMVYRPWSWQVGLTVTLITLAALAVWGGWSALRRR
ncbi:MAG: YfhO family protein, partial [Anaerolineae bacterium]|nr:YfhO family protein [Anaerolineae bacterium]